MAKKRSVLHLEHLEGIAQKIAGAIGPAFDEADAKFALLGFTVGEGGWSTYVSNANRDDMVKALREMADVLEAGDDMPAAHGGPRV